MNLEPLRNGYATKTKSGISEMNQTPKKCNHCKRPVAEVTTDGTDLYIRGERMPAELVKAWLPCPYCKGGLIKWTREIIYEQSDKV